MACLNAATFCQENQANISKLLALEPKTKNLLEKFEYHHFDVSHHIKIQYVLLIALAFSMTVEELTLQLVDS